MGKHPREEVEWLEQELLALEEDEKEEAEATPQWWEEDGGVENPAVDWGRTVFTDDCDEFDEGAALQALTPRQKRKQKKMERKRRKQARKSIGGLVLVAALELIAIGAIIGWWIQWLT